ncbi:hypothetical protein SDC9_148600 [bioreactor metagenome]|uniref:Uncharacterized protein n=1 Tax=bioreactor metagenome TaxID=1076179 RepID=A0A645EHI1_9ZZZZ
MDNERCGLIIDRLSKNLRHTLNGKAGIRLNQSEQRGIVQLAGADIERFQIRQDIDGALNFCTRPVAGCGEFGCIIGDGLAEQIQIAFNVDLRMRGGKGRYLGNVF